MNIQSKTPRSFNWKRIAFIAILLGIAAFKYINSRPDTAPQDGGRRDGGIAQVEVPDEIDLDAGLERSGQSKQDPTPKSSRKPDLKFKPIKGSTSGSTKSASTSKGPYLKDSSGGKKVSPAGLVYTNSRSGEHRTEHVLRHAKDQPGRSGNHGVFDADGDDVFRLIDEAYELIQTNSRQVSKDKQDPDKAYLTAYTINMNRRIGYRGGQRGNRDGKPAVSKLKLVLADGKRVITAYPF